MSAPEHPTPPNETPKRRRLGFGWWLAIVGTIIIGLPLAALTAWSIGATRRAEAELARIRAAGEPLDASEFGALNQSPPPASDATGLWLEAFGRLATPEFNEAARPLPIIGNNDDEIPASGCEWSQLSIAEDLLSDNSGPLPLLHEAAELGGAARFPMKSLKLLDGLDTDVVRGMRTAGRVLALESHVAAHRNASARATEAIRAILALGRSLENNPTSLALLMRFMQYHLACEQIEKLLPQVKFSDGELRALQLTLRSTSLENGLRRAIQYERAVAVAVFDDEKMWRVSDDRPLILARCTRGYDLAVCLDYYAKLLLSADLTWHDGFHERIRLDEQLDRQVETGPLSEFQHSFISALVGMAQTACREGCRLTSEMGTADAGLAAELYRRQHGEFPEVLDQLVPEFLPAVPVDPYDGQPLRYVVNEEGCIVYSVGKDCVDDGGRRDEKLPDRPDVTFRVPRPEVP